MKNLLIFILLLTAPSMISTAGCTGERRGQDNIISVSILPLKYFVSRIGGDSFTVNVLIPPGQSPHTYELTSSQMIELTRSRAYFMTGLLPFEVMYRESIASANRNMPVFELSRGVRLITGHHHEHESGADPHIWLSPRAAKIMAKNILEGFIGIDPANKSLYENNCEALLRDIDSLDAYFSEQLKSVKQKNFLVYHPVWSYLARDYDLVQVPIENEGKEPDPSHMKDIIDRARREGLRTIFIQKEVPRDYATALAGDIHGSVIQLDPLAPDWLENMRRIAEILGRELSQGGKHDE